MYSARRSRLISIGAITTIWVRRGISRRRCWLARLLAIFVSSIPLQRW